MAGTVIVAKVFSFLKHGLPQDTYKCCFFKVLCCSLSPKQPYFFVFQHVLRPVARLGLRLGPRDDRGRVLGSRRGSRGLSGNGRRRRRRRRRRRAAAGQHGRLLAKVRHLLQI